MDISYVNDISAEDFNFLRKSVGWSVFDETLSKKGLQNSAFKVAAIENGQTVGFARVVSDGCLVAFIVDVMVLPEYQGNGIGKEIMKRIMDYIKSRKNAGERLVVNLMSAKGKEGFYTALGFAQRPNENYGCGMTQIIYTEDN